MATTVITKGSMAISSAVSATVSTSAAAILYSCPANSFAVLNISITASAASGSITVDNRTVAVWSSGNLFPLTTTTTNGMGFTIFVGPSQDVRIISAGANNTAVASGVCFINT
jgi:hypothetical protein